ncbi:MAG: hypothetical protein LBJ00_06365 [Planctomycetaceae bacterium]|nr:hypothetical protein [Planctomycetaceae bacterium]
MKDIRGINDIEKKLHYTEATLKFLKLNTQAQQREAVVQGRSLSPYRLRYKSVLTTISTKNSLTPSLLSPLSLMFLIHCQKNYLNSRSFMLYFPAGLLWINFAAAIAPSA